MAIFNFSIIFFMIYFVCLESLDVDLCGKTNGCLRVPEDCDKDDCDYFLQWSNKSNKEVNFQFIGRVKSENYWIGFALNERTKMSGGSVVDCIKTSKRIIIQSSYNKGHKNSVLNDKYLGLVKDSLSGLYYDGRIFCNFTRFISVDPSHKEAYKVKDLHNPYYAMFAIGKADDDGKKHSHHLYPSVSDTKISFLSSNNYSGSDERSFFVRLHGSMMVIGWMFMASIGIISSRYLKSEWIEPALLCNKPAWFQIHGFALFLTFISTISSFLIMLYHEKWTLYLVDVHPILGLIVISLMCLNGLMGLCRPNPVARYRWVFNHGHAIIGHLTHLLSLGAIFFGLRAMASEMPSWSCWLVVIFAIWRLVIDAVLTILNFCDSSQPYTRLSKMESCKNPNKVFGWRRAIVICYIVVTIGIVTSLLLAINIPIDEDYL